MAYSRPKMLGIRPDAATLSRDMAGIGMNFAVELNRDADIEKTLLYASEAGMEEHDLRVLGVLTTWLAVHLSYIHADRLVRIVSEHESNRVRTYWSALAAWVPIDRRFSRLAALHGGTRIELLPVGTEFQLARRGEDERFQGSMLRVPAGTLRGRKTDVLSPAALVCRHSGYRNRVLMGPNWRADVWTVLEREPTLSTAEAARCAGCSFSTAWQIAQDFALFQEAGQDPVKLLA